MSSRDAILAAVRANKPAPVPRPDVPLFDEGRSDGLVARFAEAFEAMGGTMLESPAGDPLAPVRARIADAGIVVSMVPEIAGTRSLSAEEGAPPPCGEGKGVGVPAVPRGSEHAEGTPIPGPSPQGGRESKPTETEALVDPASFADVDVAIVRAAFGVAETGSIALTERELGVNTLAYLAQHLVVLLDPADILVNLHHAYLRPEFREARYTVLHTGPSATADIEGVLIHGAQGVRSLAVLPLKRPC